MLEVCSFLFEIFRHSVILRSVFVFAVKQFEAKILYSKITGF